VEDTFEVAIHTTVNPSTALLCGASIEPYKRIIPLNVYGLDAGAYAYDVNGMTGTFELLEDNVDPEVGVDADGSKSILDVEDWNETIVNLDER